MPRPSTTKPRPGPKPRPNPGSERPKRCGSRPPGTRPQARAPKENQTRLHRGRPEARANPYAGRSRPVGSAQESASFSCQFTKTARRSRWRNRRSRRGCRITIDEFSKRSARRRCTPLAKTKRIATTSALRGISSSFRGRARAGFAQAAGPALTSSCCRGPSHGSYACSASGRPDAAVRQAVPLRTAANFACAASCCLTACARPRASSASPESRATVRSRRAVAFDLGKTDDRHRQTR